MKLSEAFTQVRNMLSDKSRWVQGTYALGANGQSVNPASDKAKCFCAMGAFHHVIKTPPWLKHPLMWEYEQFRLAHGHQPTIVAINDFSKNHEEFLAKLDNAILDMKAWEASHETQ